MAGLLDFLQGASNAAASNISAPVDGLAWLLKKAGVDVGTPVGGSDWMRQKGLTAEPQNKYAGLLGEAIGGVAPMLAAAKAPQIAKGLLQGAENLAAPRTMNPQAGAIVWHGSPHNFKQFDASKIGTGEGNQAYGNGLYFADSKDVAKGYADKLGMRSSGQSLDTLNTELQKIKDTMQGPLRGQAMREVEAQIKMAKQASRSNGSSVYKVDLPDEQIAKMLDYHAPVPETIRTPLSSDSLNQFGSGLTDASGEKLYKEVIFNFKQAGHPNPTQAATDWLSERGVPGMSYLDGNSMALGGAANTAGTRNYVVFPGNEGLLSILERNGQSLK